MAKSDKRVKITLECTECKERNYITMKSKINDREVPTGPPSGD